jgi:hypothetical protein
MGQSRVRRTTGSRRRRRVMPGRATVLRRLMEIQTSQQDWPKVAIACRSLLELDENDDDARWNLALAEFRNGDPQGPGTP